MPGLWILVDKSELSLAVFRDGAPVAAPGGQTCFPIALGASPVGDKAQRGDERTPVGDLRVTHKNPKSAFTLSLGLNYPNTQTADLALTEGRISADLAARIKAADKPGKMPVRDSVLGGDIYIHGGGTGSPSWTDGCIALDDTVIRWLFEIATVGMGVRVRE